MRKALIVGIDEYPSCPLNGCVKDATEIQSLLERNADGSPNFSVRLLTSPSDIINRSVLKKDVEELFAGEVDVALFFFAGHGTINSYGGYIVTPDFRSYDEGIAMDEILKMANQSKAKDKIIILDCCYSGYFGEMPNTGGNVSMLGDGLTVLTASRKSETSKETVNGGVFTSLLVDALHGGAADLRGHITPGSLYAYVDEALGAWEQRPVFKTNVSRFTYIRKTIPLIPTAVLRNLNVYFKSPFQDFNLDPSYEPTTQEADQAKILIFKELQQLAGVGLIRPNDEEHMYYAAINSKSCKLTAMGYQYWRLANEGKI